MGLGDLRAWTNPLLLKSTPSSYGIMRLVSPKSSPRPFRLLVHALRRLTRILRWVVNQLPWKCYLLSLVKLHSPDCECRNDCGTSGAEMRKRLEELNWRTQPRSQEAVEVCDPKLGEVISTPVSEKNIA